MNTDKLILKIVLVLAVACAAFSAAFDSLALGLKKISGGAGDDEEPETPKTSKGKGKGKPAPEPEPEPEEEEEEEEEEEMSLPELGEAADDGDEDAAASLSAKASDAGLDENDYGTWIELADALAELNNKPKGKTKPAGKSKSGEVTLADLREKAKPIIRAGFSADVKELLESFDAESLTTLDEGQFAKFDKALDKLATRLGVED